MHEFSGNDKLLMDIASLLPDWQCHLLSNKNMNKRKVITYLRLYPIFGPVELHVHKITACTIDSTAYSYIYVLYVKFSYRSLLISVVVVGIHAPFPP